MAFPEYKDGSIVNLMASIAMAQGVKTPSKPLRHLPSSFLNKKNTILFIIDGLGHDYVIGKGQFLKKYLKSSMTSVFPTTTATAITSFSTGLEPVQHCMTGWFMLMKELGAVVAPLPMYARTGDTISAHPSLFIGKPLSESIRIISIGPRAHSGSSYNRAYGRKARPMHYGSLNGMLKRVYSASKMPGKKLIAAYWPVFDSLCHRHGKASLESRKHLQDLEKAFAHLLPRLDDSVVIITADHGHIDCPISKVIRFPEVLHAMLTVPLCAERRAAYCYVRPHLAQDFELLAHKLLSTKCEINKGTDMIKQGYFGINKVNPKLIERIGDYVLLMKGNYIIEDHVMGEERSIHIGHHGGVSDEEMLVPLICYP